MKARHWELMGVADWELLARDWFDETRSEEYANSRSAGDAEGADADEQSHMAAADLIVLMNFTATVEQQLAFIRAAFTVAADDADLGDLAAGPVEHLLGHHFDYCFPALAEMAHDDVRSAHMLTGVWKYLMTDEQFGLLREIQLRDPSPLPAFRDEMV